MLRPGQPAARAPPASRRWQSILKRSLIPFIITLSVLLTFKGSNEGVSSLGFSVWHSVWTWCVVASALGLLTILTHRLWSWWSRNARTVVVERARGGQVRVSVRMEANAWLKFAMLMIFIVSFVFEWVRVYQQEKAKRIATILKDVPPECRSESMTWWQSMTATLRSLKSLILWSDDLCEQYQYALRVSPWTEANPLRVLVSLVTRCVADSVEILSSAFGRSLRLFFTEIPFVWQLVFAICLMICFAVSVIMLCRYRISLPFIAFEPATRHLAQIPNGDSERYGDARSRRQLMDGADVGSSAQRNAIVAPPRNARMRRMRQE